MRVLVINPGNTSTKIAVYDGERCVVTTAVEHSDDELARFENHAAQLDFRTALIDAVLAEHSIPPESLSAVVGRGGLLKPMPGGTYRVDATMLADLRAGARGEHASNLGGQLADRFARLLGVPAYIVDPVSTDEFQELSRVTGLPTVPRESACHALNMRAVGRRVAADAGLPYPEARIIVVHLGTGFSMSAHEGGRMIDICDGMNEGPMSADRAGSLPTVAMIRQCFSPGATLEGMLELVSRTAGMAAWLGTRDLREAEARADAGDERAKVFLDALCYQVAKAIGALAVVLCGRVDAIALTGGMAYSDRIVTAVTDRVRWIAPVVRVPGEHEMLALAQGALRVLRGEEPALDYAAA